MENGIQTKYGIYDYLIMPFGLINTLTTMQKKVNKILQSYLNRFAIIYMNDILKYLNRGRKDMGYPIP